MNKVNEKLLIEQLHIIKDFLYHYISYRTIHSNFDQLVKSFGSQEFWVLTINGHYYQAINLWCMVFGTDNNETNWEKMDLKRGFKDIITNSIDIEDYKKYWVSVIEWRNKFSAHRDPVFKKEVPDLKKARTVALLFEEWISSNDLGIVFSFSFEFYEEEFKEQLEESIKKLLY